MEMKGRTLRSMPTPRAVAKAFCVGPLRKLVPEPMDSCAPPMRTCANGETGPGKRICGPKRYVFSRALAPWNEPEVSLKSAASPSGPKSLTAPEASQPFRLRSWVFGGHPGVGHKMGDTNVTGART